MILKVITYATIESVGLKLLRKSCERIGLELTVLGIGETWRGFGSKVIATREHLLTLEGYTHFIFVDAYDVVFLDYPKYDGRGILFSAEKNCWPDAGRAGEYPTVPTQWKYLNSGSYAAPIKEYLDLTDCWPVEYADDDQRYFTDIFIKTGKIKLDTECKVFQSWAFKAEDEFTIFPNSVRNNITGSTPQVIHFNGKCLDSNIYAMIKYSTIAEVQAAWANKEEVAKDIHETFIARVNAVPSLADHRTFVENHIYGFGERSFYWMWHLIVQEMPQEFTFLEIGVFRGQILSLIEMLAKMQGKKAIRYGVTPLSNEGLQWTDDHYAQDIELLHDTFGIAKNYTILQGLSENPDIIKQASELKLDILFIDGGHEERHIAGDIDNYSHLVKPGGYMVIDDCCNNFSMPFGYFCGIDAVTRVVDRNLPPETPNKDWAFLFNVVHNRVFYRL